MWIEISFLSPSWPAALVTPLAGVWIEIAEELNRAAAAQVTPLAGVWIEIQLAAEMFGVTRGHSPCGSVD